MRASCVLKCPSASIVATSTLRVNTENYVFENIHSSFNFENYLLHCLGVGGGGGGVNYPRWLAVLRLGPEYIMLFKSNTDKFHKLTQNSSLTLSSLNSKNFVNT